MEATPLLQTKFSSSQLVGSNGWSFNFQHRYDPIRSMYLIFYSHSYFDNFLDILERGDGARIFLNKMPKVLTTVIGSSSARRANIVCSVVEEETRATSSSDECGRVPIETATLFSPIALATGADGTTFVGDFDRVRKISSDGRTIETVFQLK